MGSMHFFLHPMWSLNSDITCALCWLVLIDVYLLWWLCMCAAAFMRKLSDTIFQMVAADKEAVTRFHTSSSRHAMGKEALDKKGPQYWAGVTRRFIREPEVLKAALDQLWQEFAGTEGLDPATGQPLFTELTSLVLVAIKELIDHGHFCGESGTAIMHALQHLGGSTSCHVWTYHATLLYPSPLCLPHPHPHAALPPSPCLVSWPLLLPHPPHL